MATPSKKQNALLSTGLLLLLWVLQHFGIINLSDYFPENTNQPAVVEEKVRTDDNENSGPSPRSNTLEELEEEESKTASRTKTKTKTPPPNTYQPPSTKTPPPNTVNSDLLSERLIYTRHARCRMDCRYISEKEVAYIMRNGKVNKRKSKPYDAPCPTYALEGITPDDRQEVRIVFAACDDVTKVITTIDLGNEYQCYCE